MIKRNLAKIVSIIALIALSIVFATMSQKTSFGADIEEKAILEGATNKYINYELDNGKNGTLVQYQLRTGVEYGNEFSPIKNSELNVSLNQIDNKYPYDVRVIFLQTKVTNGNMQSLGQNYTYDVNTGLVTIKINNENENGEPIYNQKPTKEDRDEFLIMAYYDTYTQENLERELSCNVEYKATLFTDDNRQISGTGNINQKVTNNIGELTSITTDTSEIYNGYIKSNIVNGTSYNTEYTEKNEIVISKKDAQQKIKIYEENTFVNLNDIYYKSTKFQKNDILNLLGEEGKIEIFDANNNVISTIDKNTEFNENGEFVVTYNEGINNIYIKTSDIINEGILHIENVKLIKNDILEIQDTDITRTIYIVGIKEEKKDNVNDNVERKEITAETYKNENKDIIQIQEATTKVDVELSNTSFTNEKENDITFDIYLDSSSEKYNLFKNTNIKINMPEEVREVVLSNSKLLYSNGLNLKNVEVVNDNGKLGIIINLDGTQTQYDLNDLGLMTNLKIQAKVFLKEDISSKNSEIKIEYTNEMNTEDITENGSINKEILIQNFQENNISTIETENKNIIDKISKVTKEKMEEEILNNDNTMEKKDGLQINVTPTRGDIVLNDNDIIYEKEYLKYNIEIKNTTDTDFEDVKIYANIPEGTVYGELETKFNTVSEGKYQYNFDSTLKEKEINIGTIKAGETVSKYYEVQVSDLLEGEEEKQISTNINVYSGNSEIYEYTINNTVKPSEVEVFLASRRSGTFGEWNYMLYLNIPEGKEATVELDLDEFFEITQEYLDNGKVYIKYNDEFLPINQTGRKVTIKTDKSGLYNIGVQENDKEQLTPREVNGEVEIKASASVTLDNVVYKSNENRINYVIEDISVVITSENEGEEVEYEEEINYNISVTARGQKIEDAKGEPGGIYVNVLDYLTENVKPISITYEYYDVIYEEIGKDENGEGVKQIAGFSEKKTKTKEIENKLDKDKNTLAEVDISTYIPYGETINIEVKTSAGYVYSKTEITNSAIVKYSLRSGEDYETYSKTSNIVKHIIVPQIMQDPSDPDDPDVPINPEDPDNPNNPDNPIETEEKYDIEGVVWNDLNSDGQRQQAEGLIPGIDVLLVNLNDSRNVFAKTKTNSNGKYNFNDLEKGNYIVIFKYNTSMYTITEYKKDGVSDTVNSDASLQTITLDGKSTNVGVSDTINLIEDLNDLDLGLILKKGYDLKLDKYITDILVTTNSGTRQYSYDNTKIGRVEIKAKELKEANVEVKYKIIVTNEGESSVTVKEIYDYLPEGLEFSIEDNPNWTNKNGVLINQSLMNKDLQPAESREITLLLTKTITEDNIGTIINGAEIGSVSTVSGIEDTDSTPGNRNKQEDDYSEAQLIIGVSTGLTTYISIGVIILVILTLIGIAIKFRFKISKISKLGIFLMIFTIIGIVSCNKALAVILEIPKNASFHFEGNHKFSGGPFGIEDNSAGTCANQGKPAAGGDCQDPEDRYVYNGSYGDTEIKYGEKVYESNFQLSRLNTQIGVRKLVDNYILGPFETFSNSTEDYIITITDKEGKRIDGWAISDENGIGMLRIGGTEGGSGVSFYITLNEELFARGISKLEVRQAKLVSYKQSYWQYSSLYYKYYGGYCSAFSGTSHQNVYTPKYEHDQGEKNDSEYLFGSIEWTQFNSTLDIEKVDKDNPNLKLNIEGRLSKDDGTFSQDFKTTNGQYHFDNLTPGTYTLTETVNNNYGYEKNVQTKISITLIGGKPNKVTMTNIKYTGNLKIIKKDMDNNNKILEGVEFKLQNSNGYVIGVDDAGKNITSAKGTVHFSDMKYTNDINQATTFITDSKGEINIYDIREGVYTVKEISFGNNYGYEIDNNYILWNNGTSSGTGSEGQIQVNRRESTVTGDTSTTGDKSKFTIMNFQNRRKYIKLSGFVWEDMISGKTSERDWKYSQGDSEETNPDKLVSNVTVKLKDANGNDVSFKTNDGRTVTEILTDANGYYQMVDVLIDKLNEYYIEFTYNGMSYASVPIVDLLPETVDSSKAKENDNERTEFNNNYSTITHSGTTDPVGEARDENNDKTYNLNYNETEHYVDETGAEIDQVKSTLNYGENSVYGYEGQRFPVNMTDEQYIIHATTKDAYQDNGQSGYLSDMYTAEQIRESSREEIKNINLGLYEREQPDLAVVEDIDTAKITLNGYEHTYKYNQRFNTNQESDGFNVGVKFANEYGSQTYTRTIYSSDMVYNMQPGNEGKLEVYITYKVALRNEATNLYTKVNEVINYYDERYDIDSIRDETGTELSYTAEENVGNGFKKVVVTTNQNIEHQKQNIIYITYKLQNDAVNAVLNQDVTLDSITEITSYSSYSDENYTTHYAGVDKDSRPGSTIPENANNDSDDANLNTYEDDTDSAPSLILEVSPEDGRIIRGTVWEDNAIDELLANTGYDKERKGDGLYVNGENVIENVKVELLTCTDDGNLGEIAILYHKNEVTEPAETITDENGNYEFAGVIPGKYLIRYTYGNSSIIVSPDGTETPIETVEKYKSTIYRAGDKTAADAMTDYWYRTETGEDNTRMSDAKDGIGINSDGTIYDIVAERIEETGENVYTYGSITEEENPANLQNIEANTRLFDIKLDYDVNLDNISEYGAELKFIFDNIDFGIIRRPIQNLDIKKEIAWVQVKLANGQVIIEGDPRKDSINYLRYLPDGNIHIELDQELIQGATITIRYDVIVDNRNAEIDYNDGDYYIYGIVPNNHNNWKLATITNLYDYLSNDLIFNKDNINNASWTQIVEIGQSLVDEGKLSQEAFNAVKQFNQVLQTDAFKDMTPGQELRVPLEVSRILSNSADDLMFTNDIEVNEVTRRKMEHDGDYTIPGNYIPSNGETGYDDDYVYLTITGPTGENRNYIQYIILGTIGLITLGAGIMLIKKKVL